MKYKNNIMKKNNKNGEENTMENKCSETKMFCEICKRINHVSGDCYFKGKPQCWVCKRFGHIGKNCRKVEYIFYILYYCDLVSLFLELNIP